MSSLLPPLPSPSPTTAAALTDDESSALASIAEPLKRIRRLGTGEEVDNPTPQPPRHSTQVNAGDRLVIIMVGLPARGKTYISQRLGQYLSFFHGRDCRVFNLGVMRRERVGVKTPAGFFDPENSEAERIRLELARDCVQEMKQWMLEGDEGGRIGIYDATNSTRERRRWIYDQVLDLVQSRSQILFIESSVTDDALVEHNIHQVKLSMPDYEGVPAADAVLDFKRRIAHYAASYQPLGESSEERDAFSWSRVENGGKRVCMNRIHGYLQGRICHFLSSLNTSFPPIYLVRSGPSEYELAGRHGGDSQLVVQEDGGGFASRFAAFFRAQTTTTTTSGGQDDAGGPVIFTSSLQCDQQSVAAVALAGVPVRTFRNLDQLFWGSLDGMTDLAIAQLLPEEMEDREAHPLTYRFPRGESVLDLVDRLEPVVLEMHRQRGPLFVVAHSSVLQAVYCYYTGRPRSELCSGAAFAAGRAVKLLAGTYETKEEAFVM